MGVTAIGEGFKTIVSDIGLRINKIVIRYAFNRFIGNSQE
jgi:hypothetical protein